MDAQAEKEISPEGAQKMRPSYGWIGAVILTAIIVIALSYGYNTVTEKNRLTRACNELAASPDMKYPAKCTPLSADSSGGDYVDTRSDPMCRCTIDVGNGTSTVIDVRVAK